ncbi:TetR/AcrR family transcriptional regulator [Eubacteriaceae bacterium ES2]|nr:TetR/AcrR family transcriptional regulator [Eubacteriaceae bacterium ES2]
MANYKTGIESRQKIYNTAKELFYAVGFTKTTLSEIAKASTYNKAMVSYYFKSKNNLGIEVYNEYMFANRTKTQNAINQVFPGCSVALKAAIEYRVQNRNCRLNKHLNQFYHELCASNVLLKTESASIHFIEEINESDQLGLDRLAVKALAVANLAVVHGLHVSRDDGFIDCSSEYIADLEIRLLFQSLRFENAFIDAILEQSRNMIDAIDVRVEKNFLVK